MGGGNPYEDREAAAAATAEEHRRERERRAARAKIRGRASEVVVAWAANGSRRVINYIWRDADGVLHLDEIPPEEWSHPMHILYEVSRVAKADMTALVKGWLNSG